MTRFFTKNGYEGVDPKKIKKMGGGKANWGNAGEEIVDEQINWANPRRRSNSSGYNNHLRDFKTKFDINEQEPVFEESLHGPIDEEEDGEELSKTESSESGRSEDGDKPGDHH